ncbi:hypothetical protein DW265_09870 [Dorea longicatena]|uniref:Uncharacterized protein n=1 Tax=Dorea longicatena TaxID=88431 RepID=A0A414ST91_9FIRM|nr:hypothetical protein [Dorea longicatena]RHG24666.1 hypothetical protein DW265_09870 [Dorea longicatena]
MNNQKVESMISCGKEKKLLVAYEIAKNDITITSDNVKKLWLKWYPEDEEYFDKLPYKWNGIYNWISKKLEKHDTEIFVKYIDNQRMRQKCELNKKCKYTFGNNAHVILLKNKIKNGKLANYLLINGASKRYGNYGSLVAYLKSQKVKETV